MHDNTNLGIHVVNAPAHHEPRTAVVVGLPRSGTSMVAGTLYHLGVHMGDRFSTATFEDRPLSGSIENGKRDKLQEILARRNAEHELWGWKRPSSFKHLDMIAREFRNPYFLVVFRDLLAIATRRNLSIGKDVFPTMESSLGAQKRILDFVASTDRPLLLLSYERCLQHPQQAVDAIAAFVGVEPTQEAVSFIEPDPVAYLDETRPQD